MATVKISATLDAELVAEAKSQVGERGLSRYLNEALAARLQRVRIDRLLAELAEESGPIPPEVLHEIAALEWPR